MLLDEITPGSRLAGVIPAEVVTVIAAQWHGTDALELTYKTAAGGLAQRVVFRKDEHSLSTARTGSRAFDAPANDFKLVAEAQRITLAGLFDPMLAVATSDVRPLPHQIHAVYGELLPRTPMRFLLADDPGAGKTIMAGLYIKELILRDDVQRCLVVAPGGLVEQWQDELFFKFGLRFDLLTNQLIEASVNLNVFESSPLLIARMDQLSRNDELRAQLKETEWDLIIVDEAHRMGAHYFGGKLEKTKRFQLGELLGQITRHFLLMTATPHSGKEEDFQLFLTLLDRDRFEGRSKSAVDTGGIMRRMIKEDLLTFDGRKLFPERIAETVPYELTADECHLYERVTEYVRTGMNRAEKLGGKRRNTVGFALTVLQRRLASSPEAIYQSLVRRSRRLERKKREILDGTNQEIEPSIDLRGLDFDDYNAEEIETLEEELLDSATAAQTVTELEKELDDLTTLTTLSKQVRDSGKDRKWTELSTILQDNALITDKSGSPRKFIIFTEHRDTLEYLRGRITSLLGRPDAVRAIHGGVRRGERRQITEEFTQNSDCQILIATDAAGEGLNLQAAHLMVNYDLPWNPNRIEQRFGRIHRIGQEEVCRLWNIVASNTREGEVFTRLLEKISEMGRAYGGKVFDVLGEAFTETPLRNLLLDAIQYGERPDIRAKMHQIIDASVGDGVKELLNERALAVEHLAEADLAELRAAMDEARARRLQPHYIELAFKAAFTRLGGRIARRERGRYEITNVPAHLRTGQGWPIATRYERVTFDLDHATGAAGQPRADLLAPGHPLHDAVMTDSIKKFNSVLNSGTVLVSATLDEIHLLVGVIEEVVDATGASVARRFGYAFVDSSGVVKPAGPAPYLDCVAAPETPTVAGVRAQSWLADAEDKAISWIITNRLPDYLAEVQSSRTTELSKTRHLVIQRLRAESERLLYDAAIASENEHKSEKPKESSESLNRKAMELDVRLRRRLELFDQQLSMSTKPPLIVTAALILPVDVFDGDLPPNAPIHAKETKEVERRGVDLVMASEQGLGRRPVEQPFNNKGFDILSTAPNGETFRIEVKARIDGAKNFFVTHNEVLTGKNAVPRYRLALVRVDPQGPEHDEVRYLDDPFATIELGDFDAMGISADWPRNWKKGAPPF
ncbi:helicase-related protein [Stackebrandtia nassauensis]|uniref:Helicase domain protein n=1 Tax=Stackebrandtia nassauensis (strain DSM 44728 / CIP 108903 / NRRL B-16338 / NBRC 102104 / LLR-40K-21) TaxID=446470 RepID=D3PWE2_STANL|nr:helicase-related protein [Stackebrandtia nassauensis]ADD41299.1 helicase domain protein [Stackebrandtia nassauensis DSM 44728]